MPKSKLCHHFRRVRIRRPLHRPAHGAAGLARARRGAAPGRSEGFVRPYGAVGQVEPVFCNIRDDASVEVAMQGADAVVNCVGTFAAKGKNNFDAVQAEGAPAHRPDRRGAGRGATGADLGSSAPMPRPPAVTPAPRAQGEAAVQAAFPGAVILRPSVIFGYEDNFFNRFGQMASRAPVVPVIGAETKFQPVWVDDVAAAAVQGVLGQAAGGIYELGGPR